LLRKEKWLADGRLGAASALSHQHSGLGFTLGLPLFKRFEPVETSIRDAYAVWYVCVREDGVPSKGETQRPMRWCPVPTPVPSLSGQTAQALFSIRLRSVRPRFGVYQADVAEKARPSV